MIRWTKFFTAANVFIFRATKGRLGSQLGRQSVLLLKTVGRKSGKSYLTTVTYFRDGTDYLLVGSNWGKEYHPDWLLNLMQHPVTTIQVGGKTIMVEARQAQEDEYRRLWQLVIRKNEQYIQYQGYMRRRIPIVILTPVEPA